MPVDSFKWKHYAGEMILLNVRWYLKYALSYRNLEEMMAERGVKVDHTTIMRWVHQYSPEIEKKARRYLRVPLQKIGLFYKTSEKRHKKQ